MYFIVFIAFLITQRSVELYVSRRNEKWLLSKGAIEYGREHYPYIVALHTLFILSLIAEYYLSGNKQINYPFLMLFVLLLMFKYWALSSLGSYWNTRIYRIPGSMPIKKGPYRLFRHPNYVDVIAEIAIIPLVFHLYYTAIVFSVLNAIVLMVRIRVENGVWNK